MICDSIFPVDLAHQSSLQISYSMLLLKSLNSTPPSMSPFKDDDSYLFQCIQGLLARLLSATMTLARSAKLSLGLSLSLVDDGFGLRAGRRGSPLEALWHLILLFQVSNFFLPARSWYSFCCNRFCPQCLPRNDLSHPNLESCTSDMSSA
jgi:hypothetical protein